MNLPLPADFSSPAPPRVSPDRPVQPRPRRAMRYGLLLALTFAVGCGSQEFPLAQVRGRVLCDGEPLTWGEVIFTPRPAEGTAAQLETGKAATGQIGEDGWFELSTYTDGDGAIVGRHEVQVMPSGLRGETEPFPCMTTGGYFVEVTEGSNELTIEPGSGGG